MAQKDITEKALLWYNDVFSDIVNNLLFDGEKVISDSELKDSATHQPYKSESKQIRDQDRDKKPYVRNYEINLFEIAYLTDDQVASFKSDFWIVADYFTQMRKNDNYVPSEKQLIHVREVLDLMSVLTGDDRFTEHVDVFEKSKEAVTML